MRRGLFAFLAFMFLAAHLPALANRVFVSARSGNNANACDNIATPCQTFAGSVTQLNPDGEVIVLDSGGYGPVTITQGVTIEAPAGVTAFIHPPSGDAITVAAGASDVVTLRGLVLNGASVGIGIRVNSVGTLNVENCFVMGFSGGIVTVSPGQLNVKGTHIKACNVGVQLFNSVGSVLASIDHCHLDGNIVGGYLAQTTSPGSSTTTASNSTANNNGSGWVCGNGSSGKDVLNLEFCTGSQNSAAGLQAISNNAQSAARYSNCVFANNGNFGVVQNQSSTVTSRGNNTVTGNLTAPTFGTIGTFSPM